jgi:hypothetical protein
MVIDRNPIFVYFAVSASHRERITQRPGLRRSKGGDSPVFPEKGGELWGDSREDSFRFFPLWKRGMMGEFPAFQKAKLLPTKL